MSNNTQTISTDEAKVFQLTQELEEMRKRKKATMKGYNEEIRRIQAEIKEIINPEEAVELP
jgi:glucosamine 6-phosphate synthetase-like amidotransferase/phosphosugar isomerase protein